MSNRPGLFELRFEPPEPEADYISARTVGEVIERLEDLLTLTAREIARDTGLPAAGIVMEVQLIGRPRAGSVVFDCLANMKELLEIAADLSQVMGWTVPALILALRERKGLANQPIDGLSDELLAGLRGLDAFEPNAHALESAALQGSPSVVLAEPDGRMIDLVDERARAQFRQSQESARAELSQIDKALREQAVTVAHLERLAKEGEPDVSDFVEMRTRGRARWQVTDARQSLQNLQDVRKSRAAHLTRDPTAR